MATAGAVTVPRRSTAGPEVPRALVRFAWVVVGYNVLVILWGVAKLIDEYPTCRAGLDWPTA